MGKNNLPDGVAYQKETAHGIQTVDAVFPEDSIEDEIREAMLPQQVSTEQVARLKAVMATIAGSDGDVDVPKIRRQTIAKFLEVFPPMRWNVIHWWAVHCAVESRHIEGKTIADVSRMICHDYLAFSKMVAKYRKLFQVGKTNIRSESTRLTWRSRHGKTSTASKP